MGRAEATAQRTGTDRSGGALVFPVVLLAGASPLRIFVVGHDDLRVIQRIEYGRNKCQMLHSDALFERQGESIDDIDY